MTDYIFSRELVNNSWNVNNKLRVDQEGNQIYLSTEISNNEVLLNKDFKLICNDAEVKAIFAEELTEGEIVTLSQIIEAHKNNT